MEAKEKLFRQAYQNLCMRGRLKHLSIKLLLIIIGYWIIVGFPIMTLGYIFKIIKLTAYFQLLYVLIMLLIYAVIYHIFKDTTLGTILYLFYYKIEYWLFYSIYTRKGNAINEKDFKKIKSNNSSLFYYISTDECLGQYYWVCFNILKTLKKGKIVFIATGVHIHDKPPMHVLYVNDGYCFDTNFQLQYEYPKILQEYDADIYREFGYDEVKDLMLDEFQNSQRNGIELWCQNNNYFSFNHL